MKWKLQFEKPGGFVCIARTFAAAYRKVMPEQAGIAPMEKNGYNNYGKAWLFIWK